MKNSAKMSKLTQPHFYDVACDFSDFLQKPAVSDWQPRRWFRNWIFPVLSSWRLDTCKNVVWKGGQLHTRQLISQTYSKNSIAWRRNRKSPIRQVSFVLSSWKCSWNWFSYVIHYTERGCVSVAMFWYDFCSFLRGPVWAVGSCSIAKPARGTSRLIIFKI